MTNSARAVVAMFITGMCMGCAHTHKVSGRQERTDVPGGFKVGIGSPEVKEGETVTVYKPNCREMSRPRGGMLRQCHDQVVGKAVVLKTLDHESAIVSPENGLVMDTSMKVEKQ